MFLRIGILGLSHKEKNLVHEKHEKDTMKIQASLPF